jgi:phage gpG-like protein
MDVQIDDRNLRETLANAKAVAAKPPMKDVATILAQGIRNAFRSETDPWGAPWPPHSPLTLSVSRQRLLDTGRLYASIRDEHTETSASISVGAGLPDPRATVNQFGTTNAGRSRNVRIPARPFFPLRDERTVSLPDQWQAQIEGLIAERLEKAAA